MNSNINLLPKKQEKNAANKKIKTILWIIASFFLVSVSLSALVVFILKASSSVSSLKSEEEQLKVRIATLQQKNIKYSFLSDRLTFSSTIISKRPEFDKKLVQIIAILPQNLKVDQMSLDKSKFSASITTDSLSSSEILFDNIKDVVSNKKLFSKVNLSGITLNPQSGQYVFSITADLL